MSAIPGEYFVDFSHQRKAPFTVCASCQLLGFNVGNREGALIRCLVTTQPKNLLRTDPDKHGNSF